MQPIKLILSFFFAQRTRRVLLNAICVEIGINKIKPSQASSPKILIDFLAVRVSETAPIIDTCCYVTSNE